jgi:hypothetical protein
MVSLVRRLELFPSNELILSTRKLFEDEIYPFFPSDNGHLV